MLFPPERFLHYVMGRPPSEPAWVFVALRYLSTRAARFRVIVLMMTHQRLHAATHHRSKTLHLPFRRAPAVTRAPPLV